MKIIYVFMTSLILFSCKNQTTNPPDNKKETPKALQKKENDYSLSKRGENDLVTSLYNGLVDTTASLKQLESEIEAIYESKGDSLETILDYKSQSSKFYSSADHHLNRIKDSALKEKIAQHIKNSIAKYDALRAGHEGLLNNINSNEQPLSDLHTILRILSTLPIMEKYQKDHLPSQRPLKNLNNEMNHVINKLDTEVKKY